jgi:hypothetical protein
MFWISVMNSSEFMNAVFLDGYTSWSAVAWQAASSCEQSPLENIYT